MMAIKAALAARGEKRSVVLVAESAHGTNPATAALLGYAIETVPARADGTVDPQEVRKRLSPEVAAIMLTNPNTCGLFERDVVAIAEAVHAAGAYFYADGANFNAIVGKVRPGDLGVDAMHINLPRRRPGGAVGRLGALHAGPLCGRRRRWPALRGACGSLPPCGGGSGRGGSQNIGGRDSPHP
jgi:glycine cleavage system protein P-like pyridoxal-binding family